ncbi:MAG: hypothetical protein K2N72_06280, partial [Oscillospiraceae bacterium]|nr:hypothetical protein [Oscillospiraceae bacterium]
LYAPYIKYRITEQNTEPEEINLQECGDFKYGYFPPLGLSENGFNVGSVNIYEFEREMFTGVFEREGEGEWVEKPVSGSYLFGEYSYGNICIYYPLDKLLKSGAEIENIGAAWVNHGKYFKTRGIAKAQVCGEYAVFTLLGDGQSFMLADIGGQGEYVPVIPGKNK